MTFYEIYDDVKEDNVDARRAKNKPLTLITNELISKFQGAMKEKNTTELNAVRLVGKVQAEHTETKSFISDSNIEEHNIESIMINYCGIYLPKMIETKEELIPYIEIAILKIEEELSMRQMGKIISSVKEDTKGAVDGKFLSTVVREYIQGAK